MPENHERKTLDERHQMSDLERLRHSCAHVLATAVLRIWPDAQLAGGPPVDSGFYYDIDLDHSITPDVFEKIEAEMKKIVKENQTFERMVVSRDEALALAKSGRLGALSERDGESVFKTEMLHDILKMLSEHGLVLEACAVNPLQALAGIVALEEGRRHAHHLECLAVTCPAHMRSGTQVPEVSVLEERDLFVLRNVLQQVDLEDRRLVASA